MSVLVCGLALFIIAFLLHIAIWRFKKPANNIKVLITLFNLVLVFGMTVLIFLGYAYPDFSILPHRLASYIYITVFFCSLFICYLLSYPAIEADSPSLVIVRYIHQAGKSGLFPERIKELLKDDLLVMARIKDLVDAGLADFSGQIYKINKKGVLFILPFIAYRRLLGLGKGG